MDNRTKAALLLNSIQAPCTAFKKLCRNYDPQELWHSQSLWDELNLTVRMKQRLSEFLDSGWAENEDDRIYTFGARFITALDVDYPVRLSELKKPPVGLYVKGIVNLSLPSVAIVGTRKCSAYAEGVALNLGKSLARNGIHTVSGGAKGIDTAGHRGTLSENGVTVVIFGTGLDRTYPIENRDLFSRILERGAWVTEYSFGTDGNTWRFPERDRLIAALASWIVVAESPEDGGAMHTARQALGIRREVWSIPGRIIDDVSKGSNMLMREGSTMFFSINDFINTITSGRGQMNIAFEESTQPPIYESAGLDDNAKIIYSIIQSKSGITADNLITESGIDFAEIQSALNDLEFCGLVKNSGGRYSAGI